jgi:hypothetical protein
MSALFSLALATLVVAILTWGLRVLPRENMQILATIPRRRGSDGSWQGVNLTWYGVMQMVAALIAIALALVLTGAAGVPVLTTGAIIGLTLAVAMPAASLVARLVERRKGTFTVGGAVFVTTLVLPWLARAADAIGNTEHATSVMGALAVAYPLGEGIGRLACISFGCCYGRPLARCGPVWRRLFAHRHAVVIGPTRKAAYADRFEGLPLVPAPALSAVVLSAAGLAGVPLVLAGYARLAAVLSLTIAFLWRFGSELLRADYRGEGRLSSYQWMALLCLVYWLPVLASSPPSSVKPDVRQGLHALQSPMVLLVLAALGLAVFLYLGVSKMTTASIVLQVRGEHPDHPQGPKSPSHQSETVAGL